MLSTPVKLAIYDTFAKTTKAPAVSDVAKQLGLAHDHVQDAFDELHKQRLLVPEPGDKTRIRMAPPFSGIETSFRVIVGDREYFAPCAWDSLGIPAALHQDAVIHAADGHTGEPITLIVRDGGAGPDAVCYAHRGAGGAVVERHHLHVKHDAALPVGRDGGCVVRGARTSETTAGEP